MIKTEKEKTLNYLIKKKIVEWSLNSSSHGFLNIFRTKHVLLKIIWTICFLVAIGMCSSLIISSSMDYFKYETTSKIDIRHTMFITMPSITVCLTNYLQTQSGKGYMYDYLNQINNRSGTNKTRIRELYKLEQNLDNYNYLKNEILSIKQFINQESGMQILKKSFGFNKSQIFLECNFADVSCNLTNLVWYFDYNFGNCFRFNTGYYELGQPVDLVKMSEGVNGFRVKIFTGIPGDEEENIFDVNEVNGVVISIDNQTFFPMLKINNVVNFKTGTGTFLVMRKTFIKDIPFPYSGCQDSLNPDTVFYEEFKRYKISTYTHDTCMVFCKQLFILNLCKCVASFFPRISNASQCLNKEQAKCVDSYIEKYNENNNCLETCPHECEAIKYDISSWFNGYPNPGYESLLLRENHFIIEHFNKANISKDQITYDRLKSSVAFLSISFDNMKYIYIEQNPSQPIIVFLANIGGTLGTFFIKLYLKSYN